MHKEIIVDVVDEVEISKAFDLCDLIDDNLDDDELFEYIEDRGPYWHVERMKDPDEKVRQAARMSITADALQILCKRKDFVKELAHLVFHGDLDKQKLLDELNSI